jgi:magnesium-transporting ATPase (P-type)
MHNPKNIFGKKFEKESAYRVIDFKTESFLKSNKVVTQKYTVWNIIPKTLLEEFQKLPYFWMIFLMAVEFSPYCEKISLKLSVSIPLGLMLLSRLYQNIKIARIQYLHDKEINNRWYQVFDETDFCIKKSQDIKVSDLVLIKAYETMPADGIILAVDSDTNEAYADIKGIQGTENLIIKKPVKETQTFIVYDGMKIIELIKHIENAKVIQPCKSLTKLHGKIKIKGNPHVTHLKQENFILAGSKIVNCSWVLTLVVYTGNNTKIWQNCSSSNNFWKISKYDMMFNIIMMYSFIVMISAIVLCLLIKYFYYDIELGNSVQELFFNFVILFSCLLPISFFVLLRIVKYTQTWLILRQESQKNQSSLSITNPKVLEDLGKVEYIITEKSGILTETLLLVQACIVQKSIYAYKENHESAAKNFNQKESESYRLLYEKNGFSHKESGKNFANLKDDIQNETLTIEKQYFFVGIIMCNQMTLNFDKCISVDVRVLGC